MLALTHAWTRRRGLAGYADGLLLVQEALPRYWERSIRCWKSMAKPIRSTALTRWQG
jgi:hypothetical protein